MNYVHVKSLNAILPADSIISVLTFFESTSAHSLVMDWGVELKVNVTEKIRQTARIILDPFAAELLSVNGFEVRQIGGVEVEAEVEEEEEEEKPKRGRKKKVVEEEPAEEEALGSLLLPMNYIDVPMLEINLQNRTINLTEDERFVELCEDDEIREKLLKSIRFHEKNIIEYGAPAGIPTGLEEGELEEDSLTSVPNLTNDMMTANHQAYRARQEELRAKIEKRYNILNKQISRETVSTLSQEEVEALTAENDVSYQSNDFAADLSQVISSFSF